MIFLPVPILQTRLNHRVVFEVNVPGSHAYGTVLNNVENLKKAFHDQVEVEVVCHAEGIDMLFTRTRFAKRMAHDAAIGVVFAACGNTMRGRYLTKKDLLPFARIVDSGVAEVIRKEEAGWSYLKGAY